MLYVSGMTLYSIRSGILSQWCFLRTEVMGGMFWSFSNIMGESILNSLEVVHLSEVYEVIQTHRGSSKSYSIGPIPSNFMKNQFL